MRLKVKVELDDLEASALVASYALALPYLLRTARSATDAASLATTDSGIHKIARALVKAKRKPVSKNEGNDHNLRQAFDGRIKQYISKRWLKNE